MTGRDGLTGEDLHGRWYTSRVTETGWVNCCEAGHDTEPEAQECAERAAAREAADERGDND